jgi:hypothetical protein
MNQNSPIRGSLEEKTGWISTLVYSVEARLNLLNGGHILVKVRGDSGNGRMRCVDRTRGRRPPGACWRTGSKC